MSDESAAPTGPHRRRRAARLGDSPAPVTTVAVLAAAAIAVIAGLLILGSISDQTAGSDGDDGAPAGTATAVSTTVPATLASTTSLSPSTTTTTTTAAPRASKSEATVVVANASGINRSATAMADDLAADGYTTAPVANSTGPPLEQSIIYYLEGDGASLGVARLLAEQIPTAQTLPMPQPPPLDRPLNGATVALMLGTDAAGRPLAELQTG